MASSTTRTRPRPGARDVAARSELSDAALAFVRDGMTPDGYLTALTESGLDRDALHFTAHWLGKREAVWWGCQCLWFVLRANSEPGTDAAVQAVVRWVLEPNETTRRQCEAVANRLTAAHPAGALALAAFASGGSLSAPGLPDVPPPDTLTAALVAGALVAAAARLPDPDHGYRQFVRLGLDVAGGHNLWASPRPPGDLP